MIEVGSRIRDYEIIAPLKAGGMASLFLARRTGAAGFARTVAIKVVHAHLAADPDFVSMFVDEAKLSSRISHPNVVHVEELGEHDGMLFLVMEYVHGASLMALVRDLTTNGGRLTPDVATWIVARIADGLHAAHETRDERGALLGVVHRDVSPSNVIISSSGHVKLIDFGVAKAASNSVRTEAGAIKGKLRYMSPEQAAGGSVDRRSDLFSLGIVLWELLTLRRLFNGDSQAAIIEDVRNARVQPPSSFGSDIPPALDAVVLAALAVDRSARPQTALDLRRALDAAMPGSLRVEAASAAELVTGLAGPVIEASSARMVDPAGETAGGRSVSVASDTAATTGASALRRGRSLAIFPIKVVGPDEDAWMSEGLTEDLRDALSMVQGLRVKASSMRSDDRDAEAFGTRLGVELVIDGSVRRTGENARISLRAVETAGCFVAWAKRFECRVGELLTVVDNAAKEVAHALGVVAPDVPVRSSAESAAIELYFRARRLGSRVMYESEGTDLLGAARALAPDDPSIIAAHAVWLLRMSFDPAASKDSLSRARQSAERALELAPERAESWHATAQIRNVQGDPAGALRALRRAIKCGPSVAEAHGMAGRLLTDADSLDAATKLLDHALWLDPEDDASIAGRVRIHALHGEWPAAEKKLGGLARVSDALLSGQAGRYALWLGRPFAGMKRDVPMLPLVKPFWRAAWQVLDGKVLDANAIDEMERAFAIMPAHSLGHAVGRQIQAEVLLSSGDRTGAITAIECGERSGLYDLSWLDRCPLTAPLRGDARFEAVRSRIVDRAAVVAAAWS